MAVALHNLRLTINLKKQTKKTIRLLIQKCFFFFFVPNTELKVDFVTYT